MSEDVPPSFPQPNASGVSLYTCERGVRFGASHSRDPARIIVCRSAPSGTVVLLQCGLVLLPPTIVALPFVRGLLSRTCAVLCITRIWTDTLGRRRSPSSCHVLHAVSLKKICTASYLGGCDDPIREGIRPTW